MANGSPVYDKHRYDALAAEIYHKSSSKINAIGCLGFLLLLAIARFADGTVILLAFVVFYVGNIVLSIQVQNRQVEETGGGLPGLKGYYWNYAIKRRLKILGFLGSLIFGIFFRFILPAVDAGIQDANRGWDD